MKLGWLLPAIALAGCANNPAPVPDTGYPRPKPTVQTGPTNEITVTDPQAVPSAWLSNGHVGIRINRRGDGEGEPTFYEDGYEQTGEEKLLPEPTILPPLFKLNGNLPNPAEFKDYSQTLDTLSGALTTNYRVRAHQVKHRLALSSFSNLIAEEVKISPPAGITVSLDGGDFIEANQLPVERSSAEVFGYRKSWNRSSHLFAKKEGEELVLQRICRFDHRSAPKDDEKSDFFSSWKTATVSPNNGGMSIQIEGDPESERYAQSLKFYLTRAVPSQGKMSIGPMGLSSTQYNGHIFWDADIWIFPALALLDPSRAQTITNYRLRMQSAAEKNYQEWLKAGRPTGRGKLGVLNTQVNLRGVKYPWESSVTGKETVPGPSKYQDHITGSVVWSLFYAQKLGLASYRDVLGVATRAGTFYETRKSQNGGIQGTMSPDENHIGDNDLYTNLVAQLCIDQMPLNGVRLSLPLPKDDKSFLTYDNDPVRGYKQAAAVLAIYPLQYPPAEKQAAMMLERFMDKVTKNGPAMTDSVHATILARLGRPEEAYALWKKDQAEFANHPLMLFSEKRSKPVTYFVTGAGGWMQTLLYGFLGLRLDDKPLPNSAWKMKLRSGAYLSAIPQLPKAWKKLSLTLWLDGEWYQVEASGKKFTATPTVKKP